MFKILQAPNPVLSQQAKHVAKIDKSIQQLLEQMEETLDHATDPEGVGLAAPQIGKSLQLFIVRESPDAPLLTFINPKIESTFDQPAQKKLANEPEAKEKKGVQLEGCLSLKDIWGVVQRKYGVVLSYQDEHGTKHHKKFDGFLATILQHECDHLQGFLFTKRVLEQKNELYHSVKNSKGEVEFEEINI